jgi:uncharacterized cupredoxin-like copper-binding protein
MKKIITLNITIFMAALVGLASAVLYAGGTHDHNKHVIEYDPVHNEFGMYKPGMHVTKTIEIKMSDMMRFTPDMINVKQGDVIKFVHKNTGEQVHEFVLGTPVSLDKHAEMMKKFPGMEHEEPYMIHVAPGEKGEVTWKFSESGEFAFGCLIPGHYDAGMKGTVSVGS